jgi:GT2 family glycosyltransferase
MTAPLISVLMPSYNHESFIAEAMSSVLAQSHAKLELIVIDDASGDGTWAAMESIADDRLTRIRHTTNQGAHATLNEAMALARGDYVAILNSDDVYAPRRLERLIATAAESGGADAFIFTDVDFIDAANASAEAHPRGAGYRTLRGNCLGMTAREWFLMGNPAISTSNFFFSRRLADKVGGFAPLRYTHDWDWALRACRHVAPIWLHEPLLAYRVHSTNTLAEADTWRHIHENSHIQARALMALPPAADPEAEAFGTCRALLRNESFHPLALLCFMLLRQAGVADSRLEHYARTGEPDWLLQRLGESAGSPETLFRSAPYLAEREQVIAAQATLVEARQTVIDNMVREIAARDDTIAGQAALIEERWDTIQRMSQEIASRDQAIAGQATLLEERYDSIERMNGEIASRDNVIASQAALVEERYATIAHMSAEIASRDLAIASRDQAIASQTALIEERYGIIERLSQEIAHRDEVVASQKALIEERWHAIEQMGREIGDRDKALASLGEQAAAMASELNVLRAHPWIRFSRYLRRKLNILG